MTRPAKKAIDAQLESLYSLSPGAIWRQVRNEHISFWLVCGYLFFEYVRPQSIYPAVDILPWASLFAVGALVTSFFDKAPGEPASSLTKYVLLYGVIVLLSASLGYNPRTSFEHLGDYWHWVVIYFAIIRAVRTRARFFIFFTLYMLCNFKMSQHGFFSSAKRGFSFDNWGVTGAPGWFQNSGEFGIQLCIFTPLIVAFVMAVRPYCNRVTRVILYFVPLTAVSSVIASSSRGAVVGLVAAGVWIMRTGKHFLRNCILLGIGLAGIYIALPEQFLQRFEDSGTDRTSLVRLERWEQGWATMKEHPLLGIGHRNWVQYYRENLDKGDPGTALVHNIFIESGTEHGFLGLITLILLLLAMFAANHRTRGQARAQNDTFSVYVAHGLDAATVGMIVSSSFVTVLYYPYVWIQAAFVAALSISVQAAAVSRQTRRRTPSSSLVSRPRFRK